MEPQPKKQSPPAKSRLVHSNISGEVRLMRINTPTTNTCRSNATKPLHPSESFFMLTESRNKILERSVSCTSKQFEKEHPAQNPIEEAAPIQHQPAINITAIDRRERARLAQSAKKENQKKRKKDFSYSPFHRRGCVKVQSQPQNYKYFTGNKNMVDRGKHRTVRTEDSLKMMRDIKKKNPEKIETEENKEDVLCGTLEKVIFLFE